MTRINEHFDATIDVTFTCIVGGDTTTATSTTIGSGNNIGIINASSIGIGTAAAGNSIAGEIIVGVVDNS
jgi:transcription elongation factor Elf1